MEECGGPGFSLLKNPSSASTPGAGERHVLADAKAPHPGPSPRWEREGWGGLFTSLLACPRKREAGVGIVADGGTYKNAGFPIKAVGNDSRDPCGNDRLPGLSAPSSGLPAPLLACPRLLLACPRFLAGIHGRAWRPWEHANREGRPTTEIPCISRRQRYGAGAWRLERLRGRVVFFASGVQVECRW